MFGNYCLGALEILVLSNGTKSLNELWGQMLIKFKSDSQFFSFICPNINAFERFIRNQTALFKVYDGFVYMVDTWDRLDTQHHKNTLEKTRRWSHHISDAYGETEVFSEPGKLSGCISGNTHEAEALKYLQMHLLKIPERLIPVKLLEESFSQFPLSIRTFIGQASNIATFLVQHPLHFRIQGDLVGLTSLRKRVENRTRHLHLSHAISPNVTDNHDFPGNFQYLKEAKTSFNNNVKSYSIDTRVVVITLDDCKAIFWIMQQIERDAISVKELSLAIITAPKSIQSCIGWTHVDLVEFLKKHSQLIKLSVSEEHINVCDTTEITLVVVLERPEINYSDILLSHQGSIFRVEKLWGIIDLGFHEHVFFDKSLFKNVADLTKHFKINETVYFNAQRAPKESRAKWRATCVWRETDQVANKLLSDSPCPTETKFNASENSDSGLDHSNKCEKTRMTDYRGLQRKYFADIAGAYDSCMDKFAALHVVQSWEVQRTLLEACNQTESVVTKQDVWCNMMKSCNLPPHDRVQSSSTSSVSDLNTLSDIPSISPGIPDCLSQPNSKSENSSDVFFAVYRHCADCDIGFDINDLHSKFNDHAPKSVCTQTLFTGEIMATKLYHDTPDESVVI